MDLTPAQLRKQEREIASRYTGGFPWLMLVWPLLNTSMWLALWPLVMSGVMPLWLGFVIACICVTLSYLPSHEAQHDIYFPRSSRWHWVNEAIGQYSVLPLAMALSTLRVTHLEHHRHANDPVLDPDFHMNAPGVWPAIWKAITKGQAANDRYGPALRRLGTAAARQAMLHGLISKLLFFGILTVLAWTGWPLEAALLWWLPRHVGLAYINFYLSWAPHYPDPQVGRYNDTRAFKSRLGNLGSLGMQYHIIHHLYPTIPLNRHPAVYRELRPILKQQGCAVGDLHG